MSTYQDRVMAEFDRLARIRNLDTSVAASYANVGTLLAQRGFTTVARLNYQFSRGHNHVEFAGYRLGPGLRGVLWAEHEDDKVRIMFRTWSYLLDGGDPQRLFDVTTNEPAEQMAALDELARA